MLRRCAHFGCAALRSAFRRQPHAVRCPPHMQYVRPPGGHGAADGGRPGVGGGGHGRCRRCACRWWSSWRGACKTACKTVCSHSAAACVPWPAICLAACQAHAAPGAMHGGSMRRLSPCAAGTLAAELRTLAGQRLAERGDAAALDCPLPWITLRLANVRSAMREPRGPHEQRRALLASAAAAACLRRLSLGTWLAKPSRRQCGLPPSAALTHACAHPFYPLLDTRTQGAAAADGPCRRGGRRCTQTGRRICVAACSGQRRVRTRPAHTRAAPCVRLLRRGTGRSRGRARSAMLQRQHVWRPGGRHTAVR